MIVHELWIIMFQSTLPCEERPHGRTYFVLIEEVSIHAPA